MQNSLIDLSGKVALVTGGAAGIGYACAFALAQAGAKVMIADLNPTTANQAAQEIHEKTGSEVQCVACNILEDDDLVNAVESTLKAFGAINILVNNAGGGGGGKE